MNEEFLKPKLVGRRFDDHTLPLEILKDFAAFEEMLVEVAKRQYLSSNPHRTRAPKGFTKSLELHLSAIEDGSAIPVIMLTFATLFPSAEAAYFQQAKEQIIDAIASVEVGQTPAMSPDLLRYFDRFGRGLRPGEAMEFPRANGGVTSLTQVTREKLLRASQAEEWTEEVTLKGRIPEADQADFCFEIELRDGVKLKAPLAEQHREVVLDAFKAYRQGQLVAVQGVIKRDRSHRAKGFESVEHITQLDPLDIETRLEELSTLEDGWLNGRGQGFDSDTLKGLAQDFDQYFNPELPLPYLYPTAEKGIQAEWSIGNWEISLNIDLHGRISQYQALDLETDKVVEISLNLTPGEDGWSRLNESLLEVIGDQA